MDCKGAKKGLLLQLGNYKGTLKNSPYAEKVLLNLVQIPIVTQGD